MSSMLATVVAINAIFLADVTVHAFSLPKSRPSSSRLSVSRSSLKASLSDDLTALQTSLFDSVNADLGLKLTDFTDIYQAKEWMEGDWIGTTGWWDETKGSKLTGVSKNSVRGPNDQCSETLNVWMGPGFTVPHLLLTVATNPALYEGLSVTADYIVRGPTPIGTDMSYVEMYYGKEVLEWYDGVQKLPTVKNLPPSASFSARLLASPVQVAVSGLSLAEATSVSTEHVTRWLRWLKEAKAVEARQRGAMNARDDKQRQFAYRAAVADSVSKIGADFGKTVGACSTGPVSEAYVGGGS